MPEPEALIGCGEDMPRHPTSPLSQDSIVKQLQAKRAYYAEQVAYIDNLLAGIDRALSGADTTLTGATVIATAPIAHAPPPTGGAPSAFVAPRLKEKRFEFGCFHGYSFAAAAIATIPIIGDKAHPPSSGQIVAAIASTGYPMAAVKPESVLNGALKKREDRERDVILLGNGLWGLTEWYSDAEIAHILATRGGKPFRNRAAHSEATKRGMRTALERGVHIGRRLNRLSPQSIEFARNMLLAGKTIQAVASAVHTSTTTIYNYFTIERDEKGRITSVACKKYGDEAAEKRAPEEDSPEAQLVLAREFEREEEEID